MSNHIQHGTLTTIVQSAKMDEILNEIISLFGQRDMIAFIIHSLE
jgi:hypothetical protein